VEVQSPSRVEQPDTLPLEVTAGTTQTLTLDPRSLEDETGTRTLVHTRANQTLTLENQTLRLHKWSPIGYRPSARQVQFAGQ